MPRGSTWNIWDFHLHTPYSILNNQFGDPSDDATWDRYIDAIETETSKRGIAAIGITDYFMVDGYKRVRAYQQSGRLKNLLIFPNIEFRVDRIIYRTKGVDNPKRLNIHVLFSPELPVNYIEEHFLDDLYFTHETHPIDGPDRRKLKRSNLEEFGETLRSQEPKLQSRSALEVGCVNAVVGIEQIKQRLGEDGRFRGKYLLVLADEDLSVMEWGRQDHATRQQLLQMSHAVFSSNENTRRWCLGHFHDKEDTYIDEFKSLKPCIWGCDSHGYDQRFLEPDGQRYCWIKGDVSWEGLKQILYEPEHRVRIQEQNPEPPKSYFTLDTVGVGQTQVNNALCISELDLNLNHNLIAIIGGRGSGKTALLDLIADCFPEGNKLKKLENSFYQRVYGNRGRNAPSTAPVPTTIRFRSNDEFHKQVGVEDVVFERADILYLTQNHMDDYTANPSRLYDHIVDLVFNQKSDQLERYNALFEEARELQQQIESRNLEIQQLHEQAEGQVDREQAERTQKDGELADSGKRLTEHELQLSGSGLKAPEFMDKLISFRKHRDRMVGVQERLNNMLQNISQFYNQYKLDAQTINEQLIQLDAPTQLQVLPTKLDELDSVFRLISEHVSTLLEAVLSTETEMKSVEGQLNALQGIDRVIAELRRSIDSITHDIELIDTRIQDLRDKEQRIISIDDHRVQTYAALMRKVVEQRSYLQTIIDQFETGQDDLLHGLSFAPVVDTSIRDEYISRIAGKVDGRVHSTGAIETELAMIINAVDEHLNSLTLSDDESDISATLPLAQQLRTWANKIRLRRSVTASEFFNALFSPFFRIGLHIEFNARPLETLSMGERAVVLLKILLGLDDKPLLIDQPEEHLDNRYIYDELTPAFRSAKARRQIIIATHNANLVVNTDAEQIIVAEHTNGVLSYRVGTLEDLTVRESIKTILEGGDQAFKKREEKYGYRF